MARLDVPFHTRQFANQEADDEAGSEGEEGEEKEAPPGQGGRRQSVDRQLRAERQGRSIRRRLCPDEHAEGEGEENHVETGTSDGKTSEKMD